MLDRIHRHLDLITASMAVGGALLLGVAPQAAAQTLDPRYGAAVEFQNFGPYSFTGQTSAGGSVATGPGGAVITEGAASFSGSPPLHVNTTSIPGRGVIARAYLFDQLTFSVAGGGTAQVPVRMAGQWNAAGGSVVKYSLFLDTLWYSGYIFSTGLTESFLNGAPLPSAFTYTGSYLTGASGSFIVDALWTVVDGGVHNIFSQVYADTSNDGHATIDDPLTISLPAGVTFTAASNAAYTAVTTPIPEPSTWLLFGSGVMALTWMRRRLRPPA